MKPDPNGWKRGPSTPSTLSDSTSKSELSNISDQLETDLDWIPFEQEDLQAILFYSWLKSKLLRKDKYEVLLEVVNSSMDS